jgi:branched-chain amino acid transport system permease protein
LTEIPGLTTLPVALGVAFLALIGAHNLMRSEHGKNCLAVGQDEVAAQMMGVNLFTTKLKALFISAFYAGVAGGLFGFYMTYLSPSNFGIGKSSDLLAAVVFGGMQSLIGPVITAFLLVGIPELLRFLLDWRLVIYGILFVVVMVYRPPGHAGLSRNEFPLALGRHPLAQAGQAQTSELGHHHGKA